jgi:hypothetical protein
MIAAEIASALGAAYRSGEWWRCRCPVHRSRTGRSASLALRDGDRGLIVHCHVGCDRGEILAELCRRGFVEVCDRLPSAEKGTGSPFPIASHDSAE